MSEQINQNELEEKLSCIFADAGVQIGELLKCIIEQQIAAKFAEINQLSALINGGVCNPPNNTTP